MNSKRDSPEPLDENVPPPTGTLFVMGVYILALSVMWGLMYLRLITR
ncbi:MAG TPA: hypothetical protein VMU16_08010 [Candidatus Binataceae bacterium]|nr:hypothetical protein [Candidatus Binataceae bacterium]